MAKKKYFFGTNYDRSFKKFADAIRHALRQALRHALRHALKDATTTALRWLSGKWRRS